MFTQKLKTKDKNFRNRRIIYYCRPKIVFFSMCDTANRSYMLYKLTQSTKDAIRKYRKHFLPERYNDAVLTNTALTMEENEDNMKKMNLKYIR